MARIRPEPVDQPAPHVLVHLQGVALATAAVEREHELTRQSFVERMSRYRGA